MSRNERTAVFAATKANLKPVLRERTAETD